MPDNAGSSPTDWLWQLLVHMAPKTVSRQFRQSFDPLVNHLLETMRQVVAMASM